MAIYELPVFAGEPDQEIEYPELGWKVRLMWNSRGEYWTLHIYDAQDQPLVEGLKLVADWSVTRQFEYRLGDKYRLLCVDVQGGGEKPGFEDLGTRYKLMLEI